jgi:hypothetical protein
MQGNQSRLSTLKVLLELVPTIPVIVFASVDDVDLARTALRLGATGYVPVTKGFDIAGEAVRFVLGGRRPICGSRAKARGASAAQSSGRRRFAGWLSAVVARLPPASALAAAHTPSTSPGWPDAGAASPPDRDVESPNPQIVAAPTAEPSRPSAEAKACWKGATADCDIAVATRFIRGSKFDMRGTEPAGQERRRMRPELAQSLPADRPASARGDGTTRQPRQGRRGAPCDRRRG